MKVSSKSAKVIVFLVLMALLNLAFGTTSAKADAKYLKIVNPTGVFDIAVEPGEVRHYVIPVRATGTLQQINSLSADSSNSLLKISNVKITNLSNGDYADDTDDITMVSVSANGNYNLEFDVAASDGLKIGYNTITIYGNIFIQFGDDFL